MQNVVEKKRTVDRLGEIVQTEIGVELIAQISKDLALALVTGGEVKLNAQGRIGISIPKFIRHRWHYIQYSIMRREQGVERFESSSDKEGVFKDNTTRYKYHLTLAELREIVNLLLMRLDRQARKALGFND